MSIEYNGKKYEVYIGKESSLLTLNLSNKNIKDIADIKGLEKLENLEKLLLSNNQITKVEGLEALVNLKELYLANNQITEIKGLGNLKKLTYLNLYKNPIYKQAKKQFGGVKYTGEFKNPQALVKYCIEENPVINKAEVKRCIEKVKSIYEEIKFEDISMKTKISIEKLKPIIENMIYNKELNAHVRDDLLIFKKEAATIIPKPEEVPSIVQISRGFEVAGDSFKFFIRIENVSNYAITNTNVKILLPHTLKLDKKTPSTQINIGDIAPQKFSTAIYYLFCEVCADTEINASIDFKDPKGNFQIEKMEPFQIQSCKYITPRAISREEFDQKFQVKDKKTLQIQLKDEISEDKAMQMIKDRMTMSTVSSTKDSIEMAGLTRNGLDILLKSMIMEIRGVKTLVATVVSENQQVQMGALSDLMEEFKDYRRTAIDKFEVLEVGQEDIKETIINEVSKILSNQIAEYDLIEGNNIKLREQINRLQEKFDDLEIKGDFKKADQIKQQIDSLRNQFREAHNQLELKLDDIIVNIDQIFDKTDNLEEYLKSHLASDFEKIKDKWQDYKAGKIGRKELIKDSIKAIGRKFIKMIMGKVF
ncbi:MAG: leucine-rich repeat protein [Promethearchaeota archaeon]